MTLHKGHADEAKRECLEASNQGEILGLETTKIRDLAETFRRIKSTWRSASPTVNSIIDVVRLS